MLALRSLLAVTLLILAAGIAQRMGRRWGAARRHAVWTVALFLAVCVPFLLSASLPVHPVLRPVSGMVTGVLATNIPRTTVVVSAAEGVDWLAVAFAGWIAGAVLIALWRLLGFVRVAGLVAASREHSTYQGVAVRSCTGLNVPAAAAGPVILLPADAGEWPREKLDLVLRHELAHIGRRDLLWRLVGTLACCLYWIHPLVWWAAAKQREESEMACDDLVLNTAGVRGADYAAVLVDVARSAAPVAVAAMAREKGLAGRVSAALDSARPRGGAGPRTVFAALTLGLALLVPLGAWQEPGVQMKGAVRDVVGVIPGAKLVLTQTTGGSPYTFETGEDGSYSIKGIPDGTYTLEVLKPGYQKFTATHLKIAAGTTQQLDHYLQLGRIVETLTVDGGSAGSSTAGETASEPKRIRVSGNVQAAKLIERVLPKYPPSMKEARIQGLVRMQAVIGKTGEILSLTLMMAPSPELARAALDAVSQWKYAPTLLNGSPVEIQCVIDVNFTLSR